MGGWLDLQHAAEHCSLSVRTLRKYVGDATHPLPVRLVGGKWLMNREDLDTCLGGFPRAGEATDHLVDELVRGLTDAHKR